MVIDMLPTKYDYKSTEARLYKFWDDNGYFKPTKKNHM